MWKDGKKMMEGLQICVRMTDGMSFSLSSIATVTKGLLKQKRIQQKRARSRSREEAHSRPPPSPLTWLCSTHWSHPVAWYRWCFLPPGPPTLAASQRCGWVRGWRSQVAPAEGWRRIRRPGHLLPTVTTSCLAGASCCPRKESDLHYLPNKFRGEIYGHMGQK